MRRFGRLGWGLACCQSKADPVNGTKGRCPPPPSPPPHLEVQLTIHFQHVDHSVQSDDSQKVASSHMQALRFLIKHWLLRKMLLLFSKCLLQIEPEDLELSLSMKIIYFKISEGICPQTP